MKYSIILLIMCLLVSAVAEPAFAMKVSGKVVNSETGNPIDRATVHIAGTAEATASDKHGFFTIDIPDGSKQELYVTCIGFDQSEIVRVTDSLDEIVFRLSPAPWVLNDVVVTGTRSPHLLKDVPVQTEVVSKRDMMRTGAKTVDEALISSIGIQVTGGGLSGQEASIRGVEGDRVLILIDGERAVGRVRGSIDLSQYSLANVEKIEIIKGSGATLYGSDAIGGVVNIITKRPIASTGSVNLYGDYGSYTTYNPLIEFEYGNQKTAINGGVQFYSTNGFDLDKSTPHTNGQDAIDRLNFNAKLRRKLSTKWSMTGSARFMREQRNWIESEVVAQNAFQDTTYVYSDDESNQRYEGSLSFDYLSGDNYSMKGRVFATYYNHEFDKYSSDRINWIDASQTEDLYVDVSYTSNYVIGQSHVATYGLDYSYQDLKSKDQLVEGVLADKAGSAYLQYEYSPIKNLNFLPGVRYDNHSSFGGHVNPSINIMWSPGEQLKIRGFLGRGFRAPSIKQQYFIFDHTAAGYIVYGGRVDLPSGVASSGSYSDLIQETSVNSSLSAEFSYGTMGLHRLTYFYNHLNNLIDFVLIGFTPTYWRGVYVYQNIETAITQGVEWESRIRLGKTVEFSFSYNYLFSRNLGTQERLINRPAHTLKFYLTGFHAKRGFGGSIWGDYQSNKLWRARSNTGGNENPGEYAPHRTRLSVNLFKRWSNSFEAFMKIENLFDETNVKYGYWPGREVYFGIKYNIGKQ